MNTTLTKAGNAGLRNAARVKNDEFYTQYADIQKEIDAYLEYDRDVFRDKVVYCNCDDPYESNFFRYFALNFNILGLKQFITTSYRLSPIPAKSKVQPNIIAKKFIINQVGDMDDCTFSLRDITEQLKANKHNEWTPLAGDGDFRSDECIKLLEKSDIVVTNPPFSLFRAYVKQLFDYNKKFVIIGNMNAITYKEIFPLIKANKLWLGATNFNMGMYFQVPDDFVYAHTYKFERERNGVKVNRVPGVCWFTNLDIEKRHEELTLYKKYSPEQYPKYDNYDAINVDKTKDIPADYAGVIGVPITFLDKYNPNQFELLGIMNTGEENTGIRYENTPHGRPIINGVEKYLRILIRHKAKGNL